MKKLRACLILASTVLLGSSCSYIAKATGSNTQETTQTKEVKSLEIDNPSKTSLEAGEQLQLSVTINGSINSDFNVTWTSSDNNTAIVDSNGKVTALKIESDTFVKITATCQEKSSEVTLKILASKSNPDKPDNPDTPEPQTQIEVHISQPSITVLNDGQTIKLTATVTPDSVSEKTVIWSSSNEEAATVNENGLVSAKTVEENTVVTITATCEGASDSINLTIKGKDKPLIIDVTSVKIGQTSKTELENGETLTLKAEVLPVNATDKTVSWSSSNNDVATVLDGVVTAKYVEEDTEVTITATAGNQSDSIVLLIKAPIIDTTINVSSIEIQEIEDNELEAGESLTLTATVLPENATDKTITWYSNNSEALEIDENGVCLAKTVEEDTLVKITAVAGEFSDSIEILVKAPIVEEQYDATITFTGKKSSQQIVSMEGKYSTTGILVDSISTQYAYFDENNSVKLGNSSLNGSMTFNLGENISIKKAVIKAKPFGSDSGAQLKFSTSIDQTGKSLDIPSEDLYTFDFSDNSANDISSFTLEGVVRKKRILVEAVYLYLGEITPVYPTSIDFTEKEITLGIGKSQQLKYTLLPINTNQKNLTWESYDDSVVTVSQTGVITGVSEGETTVKVKAATETGYVESECLVKCVEVPAYVPEKTKLKQTYMDYKKENVYTLSSAPTLGEANLLIIPVWFSDSSNFISDAKKATIRKDIETTYLGTEEETGWHSVKSFYETESAGKLTMYGKVSEWYETKTSYTTYGPETSGGNKTSSLVTTATNWYFTNHTDEKRTDYDKDGDGYLDGILLIYAAPDYYSLDNSNYSNLWAYCYWTFTSANKTNPVPNAFFWSSYDFMYDSQTARTKTGKSSYGAGDNSHCNVDAHTFIHEMGHVFGLEDYYDYGSNGYIEAGGFSMQDMNIGGHDAYSVMAYGWSDPYIPTQECEITLKPFQDSKETILLTPSWNEYDSPFDEYLLLEFYTPTGLNEHDCTYSYDTRDRGPSVPGIRLWHVDSRLVYYRNESDVGSINQLTTNCHKGDVELAFSNTYGAENYGSPLGKTYWDYNLLQVIRNNTNALVHNKSTISNNDLFRDGSTFSMSTYSKQFKNSGKLNSNKNLGWGFSVSIEGNGVNVTAKVTITKG